MTRRKILKWLGALPVAALGASQALGYPNERVNYDLMKSDPGYVDRLDRMFPKTECSVTAYADDRDMIVLCGARLPPFETHRKTVTVEGTVTAYFGGSSNDAMMGPDYLGNEFGPALLDFEGDDHD